MHKIGSNITSQHLNKNTAPCRQFYTLPYGRLSLGWESDNYIGCADLQTSNLVVAEKGKSTRVLYRKDYANVKDKSIEVIP
jgi:hypothetical protein